MKKAFAAALTISLLAGTSALAQESHQRGDGGSWRARALQHQQEAQQQQQAQQKQDAQQRRQDRRPEREQAEETRPARPVPQIANQRAREAIAQARARQAQHDAVVVERRNDHANEAISEARARQLQQRAEEQRHVVPRVITRSEQQRYERRDGNPEQRVHIRPDTRRTNDVDRRAEVERRLREAERNRDHGGDRDHYRRPGDHQLRDRDRNRHWFNPDQWRRSYWAQHRYRTPYRHQPGWYTQTWIFGDFLPNGWYSHNYYLDWWRYSLPMPPIGAEWVRVGDDALLVDTWSGEVLSVYYDLFW